MGRASLLGTAACAILYIAVSAAIMGLVPHHALIHSTTPFVLGFQAIFPHGAWAGKLVAALAVASGIGALNGWTLVTTEVSRAAAQDGLFPRAFAWSDRKDTAWFGVVMAALLPSLLMLWSYTTSTGLTVFTDLVDLTVVGHVYDEQQARALAASMHWDIRQDGSRWRRIVPSPKPGELLDLPAVRVLLDRGAIVVCSGGCGVPAVADNGSGPVRGVEAVVDKELTASLLARQLDADALLLLTDVAAVQDGYGTPHARPI